LAVAQRFFFTQRRRDAVFFTTKDTKVFHKGAQRFFSRRGAETLFFLMALQMQLESILVTDEDEN